MSWISDVRDEAERLKRGDLELRKFGLVVGGAFLLLALLGSIKHWSESAIVPIGLAGLLLLLAGWAKPRLLDRSYVVWMAIAFALGWIVSRLILILLFYTVLSPLGAIARAVGKKFINTGFGSGKESYWIPRPGGKKIDYDKMV